MRNSKVEACRCKKGYHMPNLPSLSAATQSWDGEVCLQLGSNCEERTLELVEEQKRTNNLLYKMLPS